MIRDLRHERVNGSFYENILTKTFAVLENLLCNSFSEFSLHQIDFSGAPEVEWFSWIIYNSMSWRCLNPKKIFFMLFLLILLTKDL